MDMDNLEKRKQKRGEENSACQSEVSEGSQYSPDFAGRIFLSELVTFFCLFFYIRLMILSRESSCECV